jgi:hypothetical protein
MCAEDDLAAVAGSLVGEIVVAGPRGELGALEERAQGSGQPRVVATGDATRFGDAVRDAGVAVVAMEGSSSAADSLVRVADDTEGFIAAVFNAHEEEHVEPSLVETVREAADVTLLACRKRPTADAPPEQGDGRGPLVRRPQSGAAADGAFDFVRMIRMPGQINIDLADARTVLSDGALAVLGGGTASLETEDPRRAVRRAFEDIPSSVDTARGSDALVSVVGGPEMSIGDAVAAVRAIREDAGGISDLIWGVAVEDALAGRVTVDAVVDGIRYRPSLSAGDPCQRCGATLAVYTFGERTTLACEGCGFADLSMSLGDRSG